MNWTQIINDWRLIGGIVIIAFGVGSYRRYKARKQENKHNKKMRELDHIEHLEGNLIHTPLKENTTPKDSIEPMVPHPPISKHHLEDYEKHNEDLQDNFTQMFTDVKEDSKKHLSEDTLKNFQDIFSMVEKSSVEFDTDMSKRFKALQKELIEVSKKRQQIKELGLNLGKYYRKYNEREKLLTKIMMGLENVLGSKPPQKGDKENDSRNNSPIPSKSVQSRSKTKSTQEGMA